MYVKSHIHTVYIPIYYIHIPDRYYLLRFLKNNYSGVYGNSKYFYFIFLFKIS